MNKKLVIILLSALGLIVLIVAGYFGWEYKKFSDSVLVPQIPLGENTETAKEEEEPNPQEKSPTLTKDQILNSVFSYNKDYIWHLPEPKEGEIMKFTNGVFENFDSYIYKAEIDKNYIYFGNIDNDSVSDVVLKINSEYYATEDTYQIYPTLAVASIKDGHMEFLAETLLPRSITSMSVVYFKPGEIVLDFTKTTGQPPFWPETTYRFRYKFSDHKLVLQGVPNMDRDISFLSPKAGDIWKIGERKQIILNKPVPYEPDCWNHITLEPKDKYAYSEALILLDDSGKEIFLNKQNVSYNWDTETTNTFYCGLDATLEKIYGTRDSKKESIKPGIYRLVIYANDYVYGTEKDQPRILSDYFTITN